MYETTIDNEPVLLSDKFLYFLFIGESVVSESQNEMEASERDTTRQGQSVWPAKASERAYAAKNNEI